MSDFGSAEGIGTPSDDTYRPRRLNPYVVLGIEYGASAAEARRAFVRKSREDGSEKDRLEDDTWALHEIENEIIEPTTDFQYFRIPLNPDFRRQGTAFGLLDPAPTAINRRTPAFGDEVIEYSVRNALDRLLQMLALAIVEQPLLPPPYVFESPAGAIPAADSSVRAENA